MSNILNVRELRKSYDSGGSELTVLDDITFSVPEGTSYAIVGPSGSGKTTLLGLCAGLDATDAGTVELCGVSLESLSEDERAVLRNRKVGFIFQNFQLLPTLTALENVSVPLELRGEKQAGEQARELLAKVGLGERVHHYPSQLSGGEQQMLAIGRALMTNPKLLILDEATEGLAPLIRNEIWNCVSSLKSAGQSILLVDKNIDALTRIADRHYIIENGKVVWEGTSSELQGDQDLQQRFLGV